MNRYAPRSMALDPRTPVVVGVGQVATPPDAGLDPAARPEPLALMTAALLAAAEDCDGAPPGGAAPAGRALIGRADSIRVVASLGWPRPNPARLVAARLGFAEGDEPAELMVSSIGGNNPQALMHDACLAISRGERDVVLVTGAEAMYARALARRDPARPWLEWASQPEGTPPAPLFGVEKAGATELEMQRGVILPVHAYPLFENALRAANGWTLPEHRARIGALWSRFSEVAAGNPHAWIRPARTPDEIVTPGPGNRMVSFPYPKLCTANMQVDQGAAFIVCSVAAARAAGVPEERWVFPLAGADGNDHWFISERPELHRSPAIRLAGAAALEQAGLGIDDIAFVDLYSCFPVVVQMAARELGLALDDPDRPLTLTGGLTFGGGPGNNYTSHGIAQAVGALRDARQRGARQRAGLVRHQALPRGLRVAPAGAQRRRPFAWRTCSPTSTRCRAARVDPDATRRRPRRDLHRHLRPRRRARRGILACRTADGSRAWANVSDADTLALLCAEEGIGRTGDLAADGTLTLTGRPTAPEGRLRPAAGI